LPARAVYGLAAVNAEQRYAGYGIQAEWFLRCAQIVRRFNFVELVTSVFVAGDFTTIAGQAYASRKSESTAARPRESDRPRGPRVRHQEFGGPIMSADRSRASVAQRANVAALDC
jgi:hypothetical protein